MPEIKKGINSGIFMMKTKDGKFVQKFPNGRLAYSKELESYVSVAGFDKETGVYDVKIKNFEVDQTKQEKDEKDTKVEEEMIHGYHKEFLEAQQVDTAMLDELPEEMRTETLSIYSGQYTAWLDAREEEKKKVEEEKEA